jgi:hypothetical protein
MGNLKNFNFNKIDAFLSNSEYYDFYLAQDEGGMYSLFDGNLSDDCTVVHYDFNEDEIYSGAVHIDETIYSLVTWTGATNTGHTFNTFGLTGIDNGYITFVKENCDRINTGLTSTLTGSVVTIPSGDTRLFLNPVTGMTGQFGYPMSLASDTTAGRYAKLCGGFYQGYYKLDGYSYEVLPTRVPKEWAAEFWLRKQEPEICERPEILTGLTVSGTDEVIVTLSGHGLTTNDVVSVRGGGKPFDLIDVTPFYKVTNIIDDNTFVYGIRELTGIDSELTASTSDIAYMGRFIENGQYSNILFDHAIQTNPPLNNPYRFYADLPDDTFNIGDMLSFDFIDTGTIKNVNNHYTAYVTDILDNDRLEIDFGSSDPFNLTTGFTANVTRFIEDGCNEDYDIYPNISMVKEYSGNTVTVTLPNHDMVTGDTFSIFNSSTAFTTTLTTGLSYIETNSFAIVKNVIDDNTFEFEHQYFNTVSGLTDTGTILIYEEDLTVDNVAIQNSTGSPQIVTDYILECDNGILGQPIKVGSTEITLTPGYRIYGEDGTEEFDDVILGYGNTNVTWNNSQFVSWESYVGISIEFSALTSITFYKPRKKIPVTLNDVYPNNKGFFFYMGTRAENKFWNQFEGLNTGTTSACTGSNILNTGFDYVTNGDFSNGTNGSVPDNWSSSAWIKAGGSAWISTSGPPTISIPISQTLEEPLSNCSYQVSFDILTLGGDNITFSTNLTGVTETFTSVGTGLTYTFDLTNEPGSITEISFTINGSDSVTGEIDNVKIYAFNKPNDWCTIPKEIDVSIMGDMGYPINLDPPALEITEVDNPFLIYGRASNSPTCGSCGSVVSGYGNRTVCDYTGGSITLTGYTKVDIEDETNPFLVYGRASNSPTCGACGSVVSGLGNKTVCDDISEFEYVTELDRDADIIDNAIGFRIKDDGSIGYRALKMTGYCSGDTYVTGVTVEEQYSASGLVSDDIWHHIAIRFVMPPYDECDLKYGEPRKGRLMFYVDCRLKFVVEDVDEFIAKRLNEYKDKQLGVPFNISLGGGSQGLLESMTFDGQDPDDLGLSIESNFAGTFIGDISQFRFNICGLSWCELKNNCKVEKNRYGK